MAKSSAMLCMLFAGIIQAAETTSEKQRTFTIGVEDIDYLPHSAVITGTYRGFNRDLLDAFAEAKGYTFVYKPLPINRLFEHFLGSDELDFKYPDNPQWQATKKTDHTITYSAPTVSVINGCCVLPQNLGKGISNLQRLAVPRGFTANSYVKYFEAGTVEKYEAPHLVSAIQMTLNKRADGCYGNIDVIRHHLRHHSTSGDAALVFDPDLPNAETPYHLSTRQHPAVITEFNAWLRENPALLGRLEQQHAITCADGCTACAKVPQD